MPSSAHASPRRSNKPDKARKAEDPAATTQVRIRAGAGPARNRPRDPPRKARSMGPRKTTEARVAQADQGPEPHTMAKARICLPTNNCRTRPALILRPRRNVPSGGWTASSARTKPPVPCAPAKAARASAAELGTTLPSKLTHPQMSSPRRGPVRNPPPKCRWIPAPRGPSPHDPHAGPTRRPTH